MSRRPSDTTTSGEASGSGSGLGSSSGSASGSGARSNASSPLPLSSVEERVQKSIDLWARDLRSLFEHARERFADVAWETESNGRIWAHKAVVYVRAPKAFKDRYFLSQKSLPGRPGTSLSTHSSLYPASSSRSTPSPSFRSSTFSVDTTESDGTLRAPTLSGGSAESILHLGADDTPELFLAQLEWLYTGEGFGDVVEWINKEEGDTTSSSGAASPTALPSNGGSLRDSLGRRGNLVDRRDKLGQDLTYMWTSKLYCDVRIHVPLTDGDGYLSDGSAGSDDSLASTAIFTAHRFMLVSRSSYFSQILLNPSEFRPPTSTTDIELPMTPFTPAALHFCLGWIYAGHLDFSNRSFDLATAFQIYKSADYLGLDALTAEVEARLVHHFCHGLEWSKCHCRKCLSRIPRVWSFACEPTVGSLEIQRRARRFILTGWAECWNREVGQASPENRDDLVSDVVNVLSPNNVIVAFRGIQRVRTRMENGIRAKGREAGPWVDALAGMVDAVEVRSREILATQFSTVCDSADLWDLLQGKGFSDDLLELVLQEIVDVAGRPASYAQAPAIYQAIVSSILLKANPDTLETVLPQRSAPRDRVEKAKEGVLAHIRRRWMQIKEEAGFSGLETWALKEISDEIEVPINELLSRQVPFPGGGGKTSRPASRVAANVRTPRTSNASRASTVRSPEDHDANGLRRLRLSSSASTSPVMTTPRLAGTARSGRESAAGSVSGSGPTARSPTAANRTPIVSVGSKRTSTTASATAARSGPGQVMTGPPRPLLTGKATRPAVGAAAKREAAAKSSASASTSVSASASASSSTAKTPAVAARPLRHQSSLASVRSVSSVRSNVTARTTVSSRSAATVKSAGKAPTPTPGATSGVRTPASSRRTSTSSTATASRVSATSSTTRVGSSTSSTVSATSSAVKTPTAKTPTAGAKTPTAKTAAKPSLTVKTAAKATTATATGRTPTSAKTPVTKTPVTKTPVTKTPVTKTAVTPTSATPKPTESVRARTLSTTSAKARLSAASTTSSTAPALPAGATTTVRSASRAAGITPTTATATATKTAAARTSAAAAAKPATLRASASTKSLSRVAASGKATPTPSTTPRTPTASAAGKRPSLPADTLQTPTAPRARSTSLNPKATPPNLLRQRTVSGVSGGAGASPSASPSGTWKRATPLPPRVAGVRQPSGSAASGSTASSPTASVMRQSRQSVRSSSGSTEGPHEAITPRLSAGAEPVIVVDGVEDAEGEQQAVVPEPEVPGPGHAEDKEEKRSEIVEQLERQVTVTPPVEVRVVDEDQGKESEVEIEAKINIPATIEESPVPPPVATFAAPSSVPSPAPALTPAPAPVPTTVPTPTPTRAEPPAAVDGKPKSAVDSTILAENEAVKNEVARPESIKSVRSGRSVRTDSADSVPKPVAKGVESAPVPPPKTDAGPSSAIVAPPTQPAPETPARPVPRVFVGGQAFSPSQFADAPSNSPVPAGLPLRRPPPRTSSLGAASSAASAAKEPAPAPYLPHSDLPPIAARFIRPPPQAQVQPQQQTQPLQQSVTTNPPTPTMRPLPPSPSLSHVSAVTTNLPVTPIQAPLSPASPLATVVSPQTSPLPASRTATPPPAREPVRSPSITIPASTSTTTPALGGAGSPRSISLSTSPLSPFSRVVTEGGNMRSASPRLHPAHAFNPPPRKPSLPPTPIEAPEPPDENTPFSGRGMALHVGIPAIVTLSQRRARFRANVKYIGYLANEEDAWVGLEVDDLERLGVETLPTGAKDGIRYFHFTKRPAGYPASGAPDAERARRQRRITAIAESLPSPRKRYATGLGLGLGPSLAPPSADARRAASPFAADWAPLERPRALFVRPSEVVFVMGAE